MSSRFFPCYLSEVVQRSAGVLCMSATVSLCGVSAFLPGTLSVMLPCSLRVGLLALVVLFLLTGAGFEFPQLAGRFADGPDVSDGAGFLSCVCLREVGGRFVRFQRFCMFSDFFLLLWMWHVIRRRAVLSSS